MAQQLTVDEAWLKVMDVIARVCNEQEIAVSFGNAHPSPSTLAKFEGQPDRQPRHRWVCCTFHVHHESERAAVTAAREELSAAGIRFDSGGYVSGPMEWQLDWSFHVKTAE